MAVTTWDAAGGVWDGGVPEGAVAFTSRFNFGDKVTADGGDITMTVVEFSFSTVGAQVRCVWFASGAHHDTWFYEWRLAPLPV